MATGRISLLVSRDLQALVTVAKGLPREVASQLRRHTRRVVEPAFQEELRERVQTRIQARALLATARVSVSDTNVTLKTATVGRVRGVPASLLAPGAEFGADENKKIRQRSRKGKLYTRRLGPVFRWPRRAGWVFFPSVQASIPRVASLWIQTAYRTVAEEFEKVTR